jgi:hypothetical protein
MQKFPPENSSIRGLKQTNGNQKPVNQVLVNGLLQLATYHSERVAGAF